MCSQISPRDLKLRTNLQKRESSRNNVQTISHWNPVTELILLFNIHSCFWQEPWKMNMWGFLNIDRKIVTFSQNRTIPLKCMNGCSCKVNLNFSGWRKGRKHVNYKPARTAAVYLARLFSLFQIKNITSPARLHFSLLSLSLRTWFTSCFLLVFPAGAWVTASFQGFLQFSFGDLRLTDMLKSLRIKIINLKNAYTQTAHMVWMLPCHTPTPPTLSSIQGLKRAVCAKQQKKSELQSMSR